MATQISQRCPSAKTFINVLDNAEQAPVAMTEGGTVIANGQSYGQNQQPYYMQQPQMGRLQHLDDFKNPRYRQPLEQNYSHVSHVKAVKKSSGVPLWSIITIAFVIIGVVFCVLMVVDSREQSKPENTTINTTEKSLLHNGLNTFSGRFRYNGVDYGFILTLNYNSSTKVITDATYEPTSYYGPLKLTNASISGNILYLSNSSTNITVSSANGSNVFERTMRRGDHDGTCRLVLQ